MKKKSKHWQHYEKKIKAQTALRRKKIKALTALVGRVSLSVGWENGPERELKTISFNSYFPVI